MFQSLAWVDGHSRVKLSEVAAIEYGFQSLAWVDGDRVRLVYAGDGEMMDQDEALVFFRRHWPAA